MVQLIQQGGPFPSSRDGAVFQNREGLLPNRPRGYYHEYVVLNGRTDDGTRRIVAGQGGELFYTEDRFLSFVQVTSGAVTGAPAATSKQASATALPSGAGNLQMIALDSLSLEAQQTVQLIQQGGPFPSSRDGAVFQNREGLLPSRPRGYYHEYIVLNGRTDDGTRRIVAGQSGELFYTEDRFVSFVQVSGVAVASVPRSGGASGRATTAPRQRPPTTMPQAQGVGGLRTAALSSLPPEAQHTVQLILQGGPFPYSRDGVVFTNVEGVLPQRSRGYYHEYTVVTPGASNRGARRIIAGGAGELYYTDDHYASFVRVVQ